MNNRLKHIRPEISGLIEWLERYGTIEYFDSSHLGSILNDHVYHDDCDVFYCGDDETRVHRETKYSFYNLSDEEFEILKMQNPPKNPSKGNWAVFEWERNPNDHESEGGKETVAGHLYLNKDKKMTHIIKEMEQTGSCYSLYVYAGIYEVGK